MGTEGVGRGESRRPLGSGLKDLVDGSSIYQGIKSKGKRERETVSLKMLKQFKNALKRI